MSTFDPTQRLPPEARLGRAGARNRRLVPRAALGAEGKSWSLSVPTGDGGALLDSRRCLIGAIPVGRVSDNNSWSESGRNPQGYDKPPAPVRPLSLTIDACSSSITPAATLMI